MTTPFQGKTPPFIINLLENNPATGYNIANSRTITSSSAIYNPHYIDFSKLSGTFYFEVVWGHGTLSTAGGSGTQIRLRDATNNTNLLTASAAGTADNSWLVATDIEGDVDAFDVAFSTFVKPAGAARVYVAVDVGDTTGRIIQIHTANIWVI